MKKARKERRTRKYRSTKWKIFSQPEKGVQRLETAPVDAESYKKPSLSRSLAKENKKVRRIYFQMVEKKQTAVIRGNSSTKGLIFLTQS